MELLWKWFKKFSHVILPKRMQVSGTFGTGDPFYTGLLLGFYEASAGVLGLRDKIRLEGDFEQAVFTCSARLSGHISPVRMLIPTVWLALQKPVRDIFKKGA
jgi:hypothetical protein